MAKRSLAMLLLCLGALLAMPVLAQADTTDIIEPQHEPPTAADGWQAGTCISDAPTKCSPETPELSYKQAAGHPPVGFTQYLVRHTEEPSVFGTLMPIEEPIPNRKMKTLLVDLPPGLTVNPNATPKCPLSAFEAEVEVGGEMKHVPQCPRDTIVGEDEVTLVVNTEGAVPAPSPPFPPGTFLPKGFVIPPDPSKGTKIPVYNIEPKEGEPALFGFVVGFEHLLFLETAVA